MGIDLERIDLVRYRRITPGLGIGAESGIISGSIEVIHNNIWGNGPDEVSVGQNQQLRGLHVAHYWRTIDNFGPGRSDPGYRVHTEKVSPREVPAYFNGTPHDFFLVEVEKRKLPSVLEQIVQGIKKSGSSYDGKFPIISLIADNEEQARQATAPFADSPRLKFALARRYGEVIEPRIARYFQPPR